MYLFYVVITSATQEELKKIDNEIRIKENEIDILCRLIDEDNKLLNVTSESQKEYAKSLNEINTKINSLNHSLRNIQPPLSYENEFNYYETADRAIHNSSLEMYKRYSGKIANHLVEMNIKRKEYIRTEQENIEKEKKILENKKIDIERNIYEITNSIKRIEDAIKANDSRKRQKYCKIDELNRIRNLYL